MVFLGAFRCGGGGLAFRRRTIAIVGIAAVAMMVVHRIIQIRHSYGGSIRRGGR